MKILLYEFMRESDLKRRFMIQGFSEPIGLECLSGVLKAHNYDPKIKIGKNQQKVVEDILSYSPDIVGFSTYTATYPIIERIIAEIKKNNEQIKVVLGGYHASFFPRLVEKEFIDYVIIGQGEQAFLELIKSLEKKEEPKNIANLVTKENINLGWPTSPPPEFETLPWFTREEEFLSYYRQPLMVPSLSQQKKVGIIFSSRGCSYKCKYCQTSKMNGYKVGFRNPKDFVEEIKYLEKEYDMNAFFLADPAINTKKAHLEAICQEMIAQKISSHWVCEANLIGLDSKTALLLKKANCTKIDFGLESVSEITRSKIKGYRSTEINEQINHFNDAGLLTKVFVIIGFPWETKEDYQQMADKLNELNIDEISIRFVTPFPGTALYDEWSKKGLIETYDWNKYTCEEPIVRVPGISMKELVGFSEKIFKEFFTHPKYQERIARKIHAFPDLEQSFKDHKECLIKMGII